MIGRDISESLLLRVIQEGETQAVSNRKIAAWIFLSVPERSDNLICASIVIEGESLVIKTILVNWRLK